MSEKCFFLAGIVAIIGAIEVILRSSKSRISNKSVPSQLVDVFYIDNIL